MTAPTAHTAEELRQKLTQQGIAASPEVCVVRGMSGPEDAFVAFLGSQREVCSVGFHTSRIPLDVAHRLVGELTTLRRQPTIRRGKRTMTSYYA